ncbi:MAG: hypothetical protein ACW99A_02930 [Candidatus Kariarchaeaceae archaeon]|jgi:hypothetical protein
MQEIDFGVDFGELIIQFLRIITDLFYNPDNDTGILPYLFDFIPILGSRGDALLFPLFILALSGGVLYTLNKSR